MNPFRHDIALLAFLCAILLCAGCTSAPEDMPFGGEATSTGDGTVTPAAAAEPILIVDPALEGVKITFRAMDQASRPDNLLLTYELDASSLGGVMMSEGYDIRITAFAYNIGSVPSDFNPRSYEDVIRADIPYKSNRITLYPSTVYPGFIEISSAPKEGRTLDRSEPLNYGMVLVVIPGD